jgi:MFS family permease
MYRGLWQCFTAVRIKMGGVAEMPDETPQPGEYLELDDRTREGVERFLKFVEESSRQSVQITASASQWLMASLLAVNAGALIAVMGSSKVSAQVMAVAAIAWLCGISLALIVGVFNVLIGTRAVQILGEYIGTLGSALVTDMLLVPDWDRDRKRLTNLRVWPWTFGILSFVAFLFGSIIVGLQVVTPNLSTTATDTHKTATAPANPPVPSRR